MYLGHSYSKIFIFILINKPQSPSALKLKRILEMTSTFVCHLKSHNGWGQQMSDTEEVQEGLSTPFLRKACWKYWEEGKYPKFSPPGIDSWGVSWSSSVPGPASKGSVPLAILWPCHGMHLKSPAQCIDLWCGDVQKWLHWWFEVIWLNHKATDFINELTFVG